MKELNENLILYDWVSITSRMHTPQDMADFIGLSHVPWEKTKGARGYKDRLYWKCISIHYNGAPNMGVWLEMSGQGCRAFESHGHASYEYLFKEVVRNPGLMKITRLDVAFDDRTGILNMDLLTLATLKGHYLAKANSWECIQSDKGQTIVIGSPQSAVLIRIYDKARERNCEPGTHWIRVEMQMRDSRCLKFVVLGLPLGDAFSGVMRNYLTFVKPHPTDTNKSRWPMAPYWKRLIGECEKLSVYSKPGVDYNLKRCKDFVFNQGGNAIDALLQVYSMDEFLYMLEHRPTRWNPKYDKIIAEGRLERLEERFYSGEVIDLE